MLKLVLIKIREKLFETIFRLRVYPFVKENSVLFVCGIVRTRIKGTLILEGSLKINSSRRCNPVGRLQRTSLLVANGAFLRLSDNVRISNATIVAREGVSIGTNTMIGGGVEIYDTDFHSLSHKDRIADKVKGDCKEVIIGANVFIGANSIVLKGSRIGNNTIIGAGSVVTGTLNANSIYAGNPIKFIRMIDD